MVALRYAYLCLAMAFMFALCHSASAQECSQGESKACGSVIGVCTSGIIKCSADGEWGNCVGGTRPTLELCDGIDNDCNGAVDDGCVLRVQANCGDGPIPELGCFCGASFYSEGYCYGSSYSEDKAPDYTWLVLIILGVVLLLAVIAGSLYGRYSQAAESREKEDE